MANYDKVKIVVVGDSGVGKTSLVHLICQAEPISSPSWTIGCSLDVKLHDYRAGTPQEKSYFVELFDVGGSNAHRQSAHIFYAQTDGIILVHDMTNRKSLHNLRQWLTDVVGRDRDKDGDGRLRWRGLSPGRIASTAVLVDGSSSPTDSLLHGIDMPPAPVTATPSSGTSNLPMLLVGTKCDLVAAVNASRDFRSADDGHGLTSVDIGERLSSANHSNASPGGATGSARSFLSGLSGARSSSKDDRRFADELGAVEICVDCSSSSSSKSLAPGSTNSVTLSRFFDSVIERRFHANGQLATGPDASDLAKPYNLQRRPGYLAASTSKKVF